MLAAALATALSAGVARADILEGVVRDTSGSPVAGADFDVFDLEGMLLPQDDNSDPDGTYEIVLPRGRYDLVCEPSLASAISGMAAPHAIRGVLVAGITRLDWTLRPSVRVRGRVLGPGGMPVDSADIDFDRLDDGSRQPALGDRATQFGTFAAYLEAGDYRVTAYPPPGVDLAPARLPSVRAPATDILSLTLVPAVHLAGTVRDPDGGPVGGARLSFERPDTGERVPAWGHLTATDGTFRAGIAPGIYLVLIHPPRGRRLVARRLGPVVLEADQTLEVSLETGFLVSGRVLDRQGRPLVGADWDVKDEVAQTSMPTPRDNTDYDGRFELVLPAGVYRLTLNPPPGLSLDTLVFHHVRLARDSTLDVSYAGPPETPAQLRLGPLGNPTHRSADLRLALPAAGTVCVEVFDVAGRRVRTLVEGWLPAGVHDLRWDGNHASGSQAHTGLYLVRAVQAGGTAITRFVLLP